MGESRATEREQRAKQLPARQAERTEKGTAGPPARLEDVADAVARVIASDWGDLARMDRAAATQVAEVILTSYPDWGAAEVLEFVTVLGGRVYWTARYWEDVANSIDAFDGYVTRRVMPEDPEWRMLMGDTDPAAIACVVVAEVHRSDRKYPTTDFNYVLAGDPILFDYRTVPLGDVRGRDKAEAAAEASAADAGAHRWTAFYRRGQGGGWFARLGFHKVDAEALAMKKCLTTAPRRALMKSFSRQHARALVTAARLEDRLQRIHDEHAGRALVAGLDRMKPWDAAHELFYRLLDRGYSIERAGDTIAARYGQQLAREVVMPVLAQRHGQFGVKPPDDPYQLGDDARRPPDAGVTETPVRMREPKPVTSAEEPALAALEAPKPESADTAKPDPPRESEPADVGERPIDERRRRHLLAMLREREFSEQTELDALKAIVARVQDRPLSGVSSKAIRWRDLEAIVEEIEALPERPPAEAPLEEIERWGDQDDLPF